MAKLFNEFTNKQGLIVYDGESSADYGMVISEAPSFEAPVRKNTVFNVPGRNGSIVFQEDAFEDVQRNYKVWLTKAGEENFSDSVYGFASWLNSKVGYLRLEDNFEPKIFRLAYFNGGAHITNEMMQYGETTISFTCRPERFYKDGEQALFVSDGVSINNPTKYASKPLIYLEGSGSVTVSISGVSIVASLTDYMYIDCEAMNAYRQTAENKNSSISGSFPTIEPGINAIGITGSVTKCLITPRYYTI